MIYIENNSMDPFINFALEYYIMKELILGDDVFLFWRTEPTLMIGRHQNTIEEINQDYAKQKNIHVVRRISGGGTIYTDPNGWQFSFIIKNKPIREIDFKIYTAMIIGTLSELGVEAYLSNRNDILIDGKKISGNAQYIDEKCVLQHGSLLFNTDLDELVKSITVSDDKIVSKGIKSIRERVTNICSYMDKKVDTLEFKELMINGLSKKITGTYELTSKDLERVDEIADEKFRKWEWNYEESPKFNIKKASRFEGGKIEFDIYVHKGHVDHCKIYGDFFSNGDIEVVSKSLIGCPYKTEDIRAVLENIHAENIFYRINLDELLSCII
ncbi:MAG: lipoate--protein ligase [Chloroflexi bacterium]|nr:lipoate--protein ligase [Chloroflexota bacterium]